ncbi:MAG: SPOR domain-containing protein [Steroidobacteraceae bacterium]
MQVASFTTRSHAERLVRALARKGFGAFVTRGVSRGRIWYRVRVGPERDRAAAASVARRLRSQGHAGALLERPR